MKKSDLRQIIKEEINEYKVGDVVNTPPELQYIVSELTTRWKKYTLNIGAYFGTYAIGLPSNGLTKGDMEFLLGVIDSPTVFYKEMLPSPSTSKTRQGFSGGLWVNTNVNIPKNN